MSRAMIRSHIRVDWFLSLGSAILTSNLVGADSVAQEPPRFGIWDFGVTARRSLEPVLLSRAAVRQELKISESIPTCPHTRTSGPRTT
jgi:hypothetical protein